MTIPNWRNVKLIFHREVRDQLRDRRTLFMVAVLPILLYPAMGIGTFWLTALFTEQPRTVVLLGEEFLPPPQLINGDHFVSNYFSLGEQDSRKLEVISDKPRDPDALPNPRVERLLKQAEIIREKLDKKNKLDALVQNAQGREKEKARKEFDVVQTELGNLFAKGEIQVLVIVPSDLATNIARVNSELESHVSAADLPDYPRPVIVHNTADEKSQIAYNGVREAFANWENEILSDRLRRAGLHPSVPAPVNAVGENVALQTQIAANLWSKLFPFLLVLMSMTGAFYPAVDLAAGEKERGTMETLLICPATRMEIVLGKFFTVLCFSMSTALLNLGIMGLTGKHIASMPNNGLSGQVDLALPPFSSLVWILVLLIPLAALFSALCLALATFARSSKEGQYYLTPLLMVALGLIIFCLSPGVELTEKTSFYTIIPIANVALLLKGLLLSQPGSTFYLYSIPVLITTFGYSFLALWWAIDQFKSEDVLFREAERFDVRSWVQHLMRDKEATPSFSESGFCFVLIMLLQFASIKALSLATLGPDGMMNAEGAMRGLLIQQIAIIASPALFMGIMLTTSMVRTFRLRMPRIEVLLLAPVLAISLHPISLELSGFMARYFIDLPEGVKAMMHMMGDSKVPLIYVLLTFAVAPAICEEIAFRGFILSGFAHRGRTWLAIVLSSLTFGVMHLIPQQVFNAALLGLVLGLIAVRGNSLFPCMLFHMIYNGLAVIHGRIGQVWMKQPPDSIFVSLTDGQVRYTWPTLLLCGAVAIFGLVRLVRMGQPKLTQADERGPVCGSSQPTAMASSASS